MPKSRPTDKPLEPLLTVDDVCRLIPCSRGQLWKLISRGAFPKALDVSPGAPRWTRELYVQWRSGLPFRHYNRRKAAEKQ
jgi:predicted DNA-binding transcriptional regulator AlpA